jgi:hypothetical protein
LINSQSYFVTILVLPFLPPISTVLGLNLAPLAPTNQDPLLAALTILRVPKHYEAFAPSLDPAICLLSSSRRPIWITHDDLVGSGDCDLEYFLDLVK